MSACSDSNTLGNIEDAPLILPVTQLVMHDGIVWEYLPTKKVSRNILDLNNRLYAIHDTDETRLEQTFGGQEIRAHGPLPDFISYADSNQLKLFDLQTRYTHDIYDFTSKNNPNGPEQICDIQESTIFDKESFLSDGSILKEELIVQVSAADLDSGNCSIVDDLRFYRIRVVSTGQEFAIRQQLLNLQKQILDVDSSDSSKAVTSTGRPLCDPDAELLDQNKEVEDEETIFCVTSEIVTAKFPIYRGQKSIGYDALMYASYPIKNPDSQNYGYLGYDRQQQALVFYLRSGDEFSFSELWRLPLPDYLPQAQYRVQSKQQSSIFGDEYRGQGNLVIGSDLLIEVGSDVTFLPIRSLFDDDLSSLRFQSLSNTLYQRATFDTADYTPLDIRLDGSESLASFIDNDTLVTIESTGQTPPATRQQALNTSGVLSVANQPLGSTNVIRKNYSDNGVEQDAAWVYYSGSIENTMLPRNVAQYQSFTNNLDMQSYLNYSVAETWNTFTLTSTQSRFSHVNTIAIPATQSEPRVGVENGPIYFTFYISGNGQTPTYGPALKGGKLFSQSFDGSDSDTQIVAMDIPAEITASDQNKAYLFSDDFALLRLMTTSVNGDELKYFYYDQADAFVSSTHIPTVHEIPICEFELSCSL